MKAEAESSIVEMVFDAFFRHLDARPDRAAALAAPIASAVVREIGAAAPPRWLDRAGLAKALATSTSTIDRLVRDGMPFIMLCDARRFDVDEVCAWLRARRADGK